MNYGGSELCPTCKKVKEYEPNYCSNPFHLTIPEGFKMVEGRLQPKINDFDKIIKQKKDPI